MDRKKGYSLERPELNKDREAYTGSQFIYDNKTYVSNGNHIRGLHYSSTKKGQFDDDDHYDQIQPREKDVYDNVKTRSQKRCILIALTIIAILVTAIVAAVLAVALSSEPEEKEVGTVERTEERVIMGEVTLKSKTWTDAYLNKNSTEYKTTETEVIQMMDEHLQISALSDVYVKTTVENIRQGSVIVDCNWTFSKTKKFVKTEDPVPPTFDFNIDTDVLEETLNKIPEVVHVNIPDVTNCLPNPCMNGATCETKLSSYVCKCLPGYTGDNCEVEPKCMSRPCYNNGQCFDILSGFACLCKNGWTGKQCELRVTTAVSTQRTTTTEDRLSTTTRAPTTPTTNKSYTSPSTTTATATTTTPTPTTITSKPYTSPTTTTAAATTPTTTTTDKPNTGSTTRKPTTSKTTTYIETTTTDVKTTKSPCGTGVWYSYEIEGAVLWPFVETLNFSGNTGYKAMEDMVLENMKNATKEFDVTLCNLYLKKFYPYKQASTNTDNTETYIGFILVASMSSVVHETEVLIMFYLLPDYFEFISFKALLSTTKSPTTSPTTYPVETCGSSTPKAIYSFNITYVQEFTTDLYNKMSDSFKKLNQTLSDAFMDEARINNGDQWICSIGVIRCSPVLSNLNTGSGSGSDELHVSTVVRIQVPVNTLNIYTAVYYFSEAALKSGKIFMIAYEEIFTPTTTSETTVTKTTTLGSTAATTTESSSCAFWCDFDTKCVQLDEYCNGSDDCLDGSDELVCPII